MDLKLLRMERAQRPAMERPRSTTPAAHGIPGQRPRLKPQIERITALLEELEGITGHSSEVPSTMLVRPGACKWRPAAVIPRPGRRPQIFRIIIAIIRLHLGMRSKGKDREREKLWIGRQSSSSKTTYCLPKH